MVYHTLTGCGLFLCLPCGRFCRSQSGLCHERQGPADGPLTHEQTGTCHPSHTPVQCSSILAIVPQKKVKWLKEGCYSFLLHLVLRNTGYGGQQWMCLPHTSSVCGYQNTL